MQTSGSCGYSPQSTRKRSLRVCYAEEIPTAEWISSTTQPNRGGNVARQMSICNALYCSADVSRIRSAKHCHRCTKEDESQLNRFLEDVQNGCRLWVFAVLWALQTTSFQKWYARCQNLQANDHSLTINGNRRHVSSIGHMLVVWGCGQAIHTNPRQHYRHLTSPIQVISLNCHSFLIKASEKKAFVGKDWSSVYVLQKVQGNCNSANEQG